MRTQNFMKNMIPLAALAAVVGLSSGPSIATGWAGPATLAEGGKASLLACRSAETSLTNACTLLDERDLAFWPQVEAGHEQVLAAISATKNAAWPKRLRGDRRAIVRLLAAADSRLDRCERPAIASRFATVKNYAAAARAKLARADALLVEVIPPALPDLTHTPTTPVTPIDPPTLSPDFAWTDLAPSADSKICYVSSSTGDDANDGLSAERPFKTIARAVAAMRDGYPDWMLLKRGDVWDGTGTYALNMDATSGRSAAEPKVIGTYGTSKERPILIDGRLRVFDGVSHVALAGVAFKQSAKAVLGTGVTSLLAASNDVLIEDCYFSGYNVNIQVDGTGPRGRASNWRIRGCILADATSQGVLLGAIDGLLIEGCVFDQNGWREGVPGYEATIFNHNMYLQYDSTNVVVRNTISARASSHGLQQRPGGITEDNLFLRNPISIFTAVDGKVRGNVILDGRDIESSSRGMGIWLSYLRNMEVYDNIVAHQVNGSDSRAMEFDDPSARLDIHDNIVYKWDGAHLIAGALALYFPSKVTPTTSVTVTNNTFQMAGGLTVKHDYPYSTAAFTYSGNRYYSTLDEGHWFYAGGDLPGGVSAWASLTGETNSVSTPQVFPAPERTIESYSESLGKAASLDAFMTEARKQSKLNWRWEYTAKVANNYFRAGFGLSPR